MVQDHLPTNDHSQNISVVDFDRHTASELLNSNEDEAFLDQLLHEGVPLFLT